jgi:hypothetical protein
MKADKQHSTLEVIKKEQLKRRVFSVEFKAEVVRYKKAENLSLPECSRKFEVLPKLIRDWEKQYDAGPPPRRLKFGSPSSCIPYFVSIEANRKFKTPFPVYSKT